MILNEMNVHFVLLIFWCNDLLHILNVVCTELCKCANWRLIYVYSLMYATCTEIICLIFKIDNT